MSGTEPFIYAVSKISEVAIPDFGTVPIIAVADGGAPVEITQQIVASEGTARLDRTDRTLAPENIAGVFMLTVGDNTVSTAVRRTACAAERRI